MRVYTRTVTHGYFDPVSLEPSNPDSAAARMLPNLPAYQGSVDIELVPVSGPGLVVPAYNTRLQLDSLGRFKVALWTTSDTTFDYYYRFRLPSETLNFRIPPGAPIDLAELRIYESMNFQDLTIPADALTPKTITVTEGANPTSVLTMYDMLVKRFTMDMEYILSLLPPHRYLHKGNVNFESKLWKINHGLNGFPSVTLFDRTGQAMGGRVVYNPDDPNNVEVHFTQPTAGFAALN